MPTLNVTTDEVNFSLQAGLYQFNIGAIQTEDPSDLFSIFGDGDWFWSTDGVNFYTPTLGNNNTYYADELLQGLNLIIKTEETINFAIATDDQFTYGYYADEPSYPTASITINQLSTNSILEDTIGNVIGDRISTESDLFNSPVSIETLENDFFRTDLPFGVEGSGALLVTDPSPNLVNVTWEEDNGEVFFWNGTEAIELDLTEGENQLLLNPVSDEWGFIVTDKINSRDTNELTINSVELVESTITEDYVNIYKLGDINKFDFLGNSYEIATGTGDRAVSTIGFNLMGDRNALQSYGTEGSYIEFTGLDNGYYSFDIGLDKIDSANVDSLYVYNGKDLTLVADAQGFINAGVEVIYNELSFIALDVNDKRGTTEFTIDNIRKTGELDFTPPERLDLIPDSYIGDVDFYSNQIRINNGTGDRAVSTLSSELGIDLTGLGTEGSYGTWNVENGKYEITYSLYASENDFNHDDIYFYDGTNLELFDSRSSATIQSSATRWVSETKTVEVEVTNGELTFITLDTVDKSGSTQLRISNIEKLAQPIIENNSFETAYELSDGEVFNGDINGQYRLYQDENFFKVTVEESSMIYLEGNNANFELDVYDLEQNYLYGTYRNVAETGNENFYLFNPGEYYIDVYIWNSYNAEYIDNYDYSINLESYQAPTINLGETVDVTTIEGNVYYEFVLGADDVVDIFVEFLEAEGDIDFELHSIDKNEFVDAGYSWDDNENLTIDLEAGRYALNVQAWENVNPNVSLTVSTNPYSYYYQEPPYPIPQNDKDLDLNIGVLKPWETDSITGFEYNQGYIYGSYHLGASYITETIGGDDVSDRLSFTLEEDSYINFYHNNAIAEIIDSNDQVIIGSQGSYSGNLQALLTPGDYSIAFSSESSNQELFNASIYLSNSDPNYAD